MLAESLPLQGAAQVRSRWLPVAVLASTAVVVLLSFNAPGSSFAVKDGANVKGQQLEMLYTQVKPALLVTLLCACYVLTDTYTSAMRPDQHHDTKRQVWQSDAAECESSDVIHGRVFRSATLQHAKHAMADTNMACGVTVPVPAGDNRKAFPYPLGKQQKIDTSKWVLRSEADDRFKQMEKRMKADEDAMARMQKTIRKLKKVVK
eukprot:3436994-Rhodomonas_salina.2